MLKIKLLGLDYMRPSGSSLLRMMQNVSTPALDLIVRESLQNSLDACRPDLDKSKDKVRVDFNYGDFDKNRLVGELEGISDSLNNIMMPEYKFLSITDTNTVGLTGNLNGLYPPDEKNQNLGKLVFQIMQAQSNEGAGGSWGIGKTVYYRLGVGLVIYYSRVKLDDNSYQNRLVCALVEDEKNTNGLLSSYDKNNYGVAFFGTKVNEDFQAVIDDEYISKFLSIFGMNLLSGNKTGTTIIIPFIDSKKVLKNNIDELDHMAWWQNDVTDYLKVAIARWYTPRLAAKYNYNCRLQASVNGIPVLLDNEVIMFKKLEMMYNAAFSSEYPSWIIKKEITREKNMKENVLGWLIFSKFKKDELMPFNNPNPYTFTELKPESNDYNTPIIAFCRKPGMILNYRSDYSIKTNKDEYVLGIFVLNSLNEIKTPVVLNLDEYVRQSEKSDHMYWYDHPLADNEKKVAIVNHINTRIKWILEDTYGETKEVSGQSELNTVLAHKFGKLFMPDDGFGSHHSKKETNSTQQVISKHKNNLIALSETKFKSNGIFLDYKVKLNDRIKSFTIENVLSTVGSSCKVSKWEDLGLRYPIKFNNLGLKCETLNNKKVNDMPVMLSNSNKFYFFDVEMLKTKKDSLYGYKFNLNGQFEPIEFTLRLSFTTDDKLVTSNFEFKFEEEEEN